MTYLKLKVLFIDYVKSYCEPETVEYYEINFHIFEQFLEYEGIVDCDVSFLTREIFVKYLSYLRGRDICNNSVRTYARAMRVFFRWVYYEGYMKENISEHVRFPRAERRMILPLTMERVANIETFILSHSFSERNLLILHLALDAGLRCSEISNLNLLDIDVDRKYLIVRHSKNHCGRIIPTAAVILECLDDYLRIRQRGDCEALILGRTGERITTNAIKLLFSRNWKQADAEVHAHLCRHTFATSYIMGGGSLEILRVLLGHESYNVTKDYLHLATQMDLLDYDIYRLDECLFRAYKVY